MSKYIEIYKPFFVTEDVCNDFACDYFEGRKNGSYIDKKFSVKEAVIRTEKYAKLLSDFFANTLKLYHNKDFEETQELTKDLSVFFKPYQIIFTYSGFNKDSDGSGIERMIVNSNYEIIILCDQYFRSSVKKHSLFLISVFYELLLHELTHRGQILLQKMKILINKKENKNRQNFKQYLSIKQEMMAYANQAIEELRFEGLDDKDILSKMKSFDFTNNKSTSIKFYMDAFNIDDEKDILILKQFFKYMYEYLLGERKREF